MYRCEAVSVSAFVQQLAVSYVSNGYWFYVTGRIPAGKERHLVDQKLIAKYDIDISKWARARLRKRGGAAVHYIRYDRFFVLIATRGEHRFFRDEPAFQDIRRDPIRFAGYSIGYRVGIDGSWHPSVRIHPKHYRRLKAYLAEIASWPSPSLLRKLSAFPFEPYAPIRRQMLNLLRMINRRRHIAGLEPIPVQCLPLRRRPRKVFSEGAPLASDALQDQPRAHEIAELSSRST